VPRLHGWVYDLGTGLIDFRRIFAQSDVAGVREYIVERDDAGTGDRAVGHALPREHLDHVRRHAQCSVREPGCLRFDVLQACNPPDIFWPIAMLLRRDEYSGHHHVAIAT
jgi:hypothetical protein